MDVYTQGLLAVVILEVLLAWTVDRIKVKLERKKRYNGKTT